jgi:anti-sigma factor RsiW
MTKFEFDSPKPMRQPMNGTPSLNSWERDRFELLSAYLDGEATATERKQVQHWLDNDPGVQQLYQRLLKLRQGLQTLPVPASEQSAAEMTRGVFQRLNQRRLQRAAIWGGSAIAALVVGSLSGLLSGPPGSGWKLAGENNVPASSAALTATPAASETLMIAVNRPVVEIPKAPVAGEMGSPNP